MVGRLLESIRGVDAAYPSARYLSLKAISTPRHSRGVSFLAMAKAFAIRAIVRRRGNPNWGRPAQTAPVLATEFEEQLRHLGLTKETSAASTQLRNWCERNRNRCYIPEWLLATWGIHVDPSASDEARLRRK